MRRLLFTILLALLYTFATAEHNQHPLYIVNGEVRSDVSDIPEKNIENIQTLPANEQTIAKYGEQANNGVVLVILCYDVEAVFPLAESFSAYIASQVKWKDSDPAARFVMRFTIEADGTFTEGRVLQSTDKLFARRVLSAVKAAPKWSPATKQGTAVASEHLLIVQLPKGKKLAREPYIIML
jgi:hypothetical protein